MLIVSSAVVAVCAYAVLNADDGRIIFLGWLFGGLASFIAMLSPVALIIGMAFAKCPQCDDKIWGSCDRCHLVFRLQGKTFMELPEDAVGDFKIVLQKGYVLPNRCGFCGEPATQLKEREVISGTRSDLGGTSTRYTTISVPVCDDKWHAVNVLPEGGPPGKDAQGFSSVSTVFSFRTRSYKYFKEFWRLNREVNPLSVSDIPDEKFNADLMSSLRDAGLLAESPSLAQYYLTANLYELRRPVVGWDMSVTMNVRYIIATAGGHSIFDEIVSSTGAGKAFSGSKSVPVAEAAAARENVAEFMRRLGRRVPPASISPFS